MPLLRPSLLLLAGLLLILPASASAAAWRVVSEHEQSNTHVAALVRDDAGVLHLAYADPVTSSSVGIRYRTLPLGGGAWSTPIDVVSGWVGIADPDLELISGVPHVFWGGQSSTDVTDPGSSGRAWYASLGGGVFTRSAAPMTERSSAYASSEISSALASDGTPWITWTGTGLIGLHAGLAQAGAEQNLARPGCCQYASNIARDAATGDLYLVWFSNETNAVGYFAQRVAPTLGDVIELPDATPATEATGRGSRLAAAARTTGGVYTAYCETYPSCTRLRVAAANASSLTRSVVGAEANPDKVWVAAAPLGRLWLAWATNDERVYAVRSNRALTRWGAVQSLGAPSGAEATWNLAGEGSRGFLDLIMNAETTSGGTRFWHRRVQPALTITAPAALSSRIARTITVRVSDAGDAVRARVTLRGTTKTTSARGVTTFLLPAGTRAGSYAIQARVNGYTAATRVLRVTR